MDTKWLVVNDELSTLQISEKLYQCAEDLKNGKLVIFPTETVYGLGANALMENCINKIYEAKGRPSDNPLIVHIADINQLDYVISDNVPDIFWELIDVFWPGPVTFVIPKSKHIPDIVTGGKNTVGIRFPSHPVSQALIKLASVPVAAPSANISGKPSPTRPLHLKEMEGRVDWIIDSGTIPLGLESTIISLASDVPTLLRPGPITVEKLKEIIPDLIINSNFKEAMAPGMKYRHYAPEADLYLVEWNDDLNSVASEVSETADKLFEKNINSLILCTDETRSYYSTKGLEFLSMGSRTNLYDVAKNLFHSIRAIDDMGYTHAIVEGFEETGLGLTIMNRIRKAVMKK